MAIKVGINGFGRMGRLALRAAWDWPEFELSRSMNRQRVPRAWPTWLILIRYMAAGVMKRTLKTVNW